jgi:predicted DNA-binding transcriptional regulator YafY
MEVAGIQSLPAVATNDRTVRQETPKVPPTSHRRIRRPRPLAPRSSGYLARQQRLLRLLDERRELSVEHAAAELGCSRRTVYRDFLVLSETGVPLYQEAEGRRVRWRLVDGPKRRLSITLSFSEMLALTAGRDLLAGLAGTFFHEAAISALEKVRAALPQPLLDRADASAELVLTDKRPARDYRGRGEIVRAVADAIEQRRTLVLTYRKLGARSPSRREVDPYHLHIHAGTLYLMGFCHERQAGRTFVLDRASQVEITDRVFERRADLQLDAVLQGDLGPWSGKPSRIRLRFAPSAAALVAERKVHPSQVTTLNLDGSADVALSAPITPWLMRWLIGWGHEVTVLSPAGLSRDVRKAHERAAKKSRDVRQ